MSAMGVGRTGSCSVQLTSALPPPRSANEAGGETRHSLWPWRPNRKTPARLCWSRGPAPKQWRPRTRQPPRWRMRSSGPRMQTPQAGLRRCGAFWLIQLPTRVVRPRRARVMVKRVRPQALATAQARARVRAACQRRLQHRLDQCMGPNYRQALLCQTCRMVE